MPSASPSPIKRPSVQQRNSSTVSLSSSGRAAGTNKPPRPHAVSRHSRNVSHGRGLANMPKKSMSQVHGDGQARHHRRAKSGATTPTESPKTTTAAHMKRNSSHVVLPKNRSHGNLRKNQSTNTLTALNRNLSRGALKKLGAPAEQKARHEQQHKQGVFDLAGGSSEDEDEGEWEDSTASPELTRNNTRDNSATNSKVPTPARADTPNGASTEEPRQGEEMVSREKTSSPPQPSPLKSNKSAPDLIYEGRFTTDHARQELPLLLQNGRASRAPPAMTTATARSSQQQLRRDESQPSVVHSSSHEAAQGAATTTTPVTPGVGTSSSGSVGVSHFLPTDPPPSQPPSERDVDDDDDASMSDFMATYKPQPSESPEKPRTILNRARLPTQPSRTQQKLELQRREAMRGTGPPTASAGMALSAASSVSLPSRSASKGRTRGVTGEYKAIKQDYENAIKQLTVVRRFRNPVLESLARLKQSQVLTAESPTKADQKRPPSRRGHTAVQPTPRPSHPNTSESTPAGTPPEQTKTVTFRPGESRPNHGRDSRVTFQLSRHGSHEDILATSQGSLEVNADDMNDGLSPEEALIRRMWESRIQVA